MAMRPDVRMAVDIGGTFTDIVLDRGTERLTRKVLTTAKRPEEGYTRGWPDVAEMSAEVRDLVTRRWPEYGINVTKTDTRGPR